MSAIQDTPDGLVLTVHVQPRASQTGFVGLHGDALKIRVAAPPSGGAANDALCRYLADHFGLPMQAVSLLSGVTSRHKRVLLRGSSARQARQIFGLKQWQTSSQANQYRFI